MLSERAFDRLKMAHDASHYLLIPHSVATPANAADIAQLFATSRDGGRPLTFRSGGTSLSGQGITDGILVDSRKTSASPSPRCIGGYQPPTANHCRLTWADSSGHCTSESFDHLIWSGISIPFPNTLYFGPSGIYT